MHKIRQTSVVELFSGLIMPEHAKRPSSVRNNLYALNWRNKLSAKFNAYVKPTQMNLIKCLVF